MANDPHLSLSNPANFYLQHVTTPTRNVGGVAFPGAPVIEIGHNDDLGWGEHGGTPYSFRTPPLREVAGTARDYFVRVWESRHVNRIRARATAEEIAAFSPSSEAPATTAVPSAPEPPVPSPSRAVPRRAAASEPVHGESDIRDTPEDQT